jgi:lipopolysaccharide export LptBFGC system permease protein LptF
MKLEDLVGPILILGFIVVALSISVWLSKPRTVIVDGVPCVVAGFGYGTDIDCKWQGQ